MDPKIKDLVHKPTPVSASEEIGGARPEDPEVGKWYWVKEGKDDSEDSEQKYLRCCVHVGSNYVELESIYGSSSRVHFDVFRERCEWESNPDFIIDNHIQNHQLEVKRLMTEVKDLTARLSISAGTGALPQEGSNEASALVRASSNQPVEDYKSALILARKKTLPDLFGKITDENDALARWMKAKLIPLVAQSNSLKPVMRAIEGRIFNVELYAGLVEKVEQITDGKPADLQEKVHLFQRRHYMDEECLSRYEIGGMTFREIGEFDRWLARPGNLNRILPFPRTIVAFRVRRHRKEIGPIESFAKLIQFINEEQYNNLTFLYIRNGEQLFRLSTELEFDEKLFPDLEHTNLTGKLWAKGIRWGRVEKVISDNEYQAILEEEARLVAEDEENVKKYPEGERWMHRRHSDYLLSSGDYGEYHPSNVYYDEISKFLGDQVDKHNRLVLVLQGLLDRSPVLQPHPNWQIFTPEGFLQALKLVYDDARALTTGDAADFEAYRKKLNASLKVGSITIGQEIQWEIREAIIESKRMDRDRHYSNREYRPTRYRPYGDPGPGKFARVISFSKTKGCTYEWQRRRRNARWNNKDLIKHTLTVKTTKLLNVDAYTPGDYHIFFDDPRTRASYLKWAYFLLEAEEFHAGNRKVGPGDGEEHEDPGPVSYAVNDEDE